MMKEPKPMGDTSPLPQEFSMRCHLADAVAQDISEIESRAGRILVERPTCSRAFVQSDFRSFPKSIVLKQHMFDKNFHTGDEPFCGGGAAEQPQGLNSVCEHREKSEAAYRIPVAHAEVFDTGDLLPTANSFFNSPPAHVRSYDTRGLFDGCDVVVGEQDHVLAAQTGDDNHEESAFETWQSDRNKTEVERPLLDAVGALADVRYIDFMRLIDGLGQGPHENGAVVAEDDIARLELPHDPFDVKAVRNGVEITGVETAVEEPGCMFAGMVEDADNGPADAVIPAAIIRMVRGEDLVQQGQISMQEVDGLDLNGGKARSLALFLVARVSDEIEEIELFTVHFDDVGRVDCDEGHAVRSGGNRLEPGKTKSVKIGLGVGKAVVKRSGHLAKILARKRSHNIADFAASGFADTYNAIRRKGRLLGIQRRTLCHFLDKPTYSSDSSTHQAPPFIVQSRLEGVPTKQSQDYARRRNFSAFSPPGRAAFVGQPGGLKWKLQIV